MSVELFPQVHSKTNIKQETAFYTVVDSIFNIAGIDTANIQCKYLSADIQDKLDLKSEIKGNNSCTDYLIFCPQIINSIQKIEYDLVMRRTLKTEEDYLFFIEDYDIKSALYKVYINSENEIVKIENISIDYSIDFGEAISTSYYKDSKLILYINNYCERILNKRIVRYFLYDGWKLKEENYYLSDEGKFTFQTQKY